MHFLVAGNVNCAKIPVIYCHICMFIADEILDDNVQLPAVKPDLNKAHPKMGVGALAFSPDSRYIYTKNGK